MHRFIPGLSTLPENERILRLKSTNGTASTIVANVIGVYQGMGEGMACLRRRTECNDQCFALRGVAVGVGKIPVQLESGERMRSRP